MSTLPDKMDDETPTLIEHLQDLCARCQDDETRRAMIVAATWLEKAYVTLAFYGAPDSYHAISFLFDPPCGEFSEDFDEPEWDDHGRPMPGKRARAALDEFLSLRYPKPA